MLLIFKQRMFSWFDSYDVFNENDDVIYTIKGKLSLGHKFCIYDSSGEEIAVIKEKFISWRPKFQIYLGGEYVGCITKELSFFRPKFSIDCNGWSIQGNWTEWDYSIYDSEGKTVATVSKNLWQFTDTYAIEVFDPKDALCALTVVLAIDAEKCTRETNND